MKSIKSASKWLRGRKQPHLIGITAFMVVFGIIGVVLLIRSFAAGEKLYVTPITNSVQTGNDVTVSLRMNAGTGVNAVDATITYDQSKLQFKSVNGDASGFPDAFITNGGNGIVNVVRGRIAGPVTGDVEIAKVTFTALGTVSTSTTLTVSGETANGENPVALTYEHATVNITAPPATTRSASYSIESTVASPTVGSQFSLRVYATTNVNMEGGQVSVNLPAGLTAGTFDANGSAFNPATTVTGTTAQLVNLVFVTQSTTLTGKQLVGTIPVTATTAGVKSVTFTGARLADTSEVDITPMTANPFSITVNTAGIPAPVVTMPGKTQLASSENITNLAQSFSITNFDSAATYSVTLAGQAVTLSGNSFSIPSSRRNGDHTLQVSVTKNGANSSSAYNIRLRSPNVNRTACVELLDLFAVNGGYGNASSELDLNFDGTVSLIDLLTVTQNWGGACV